LSTRTIWTVREDLGALSARLTRRLIDAERPLLEAHGLTMWGYVALTHLAGGPAETQLALATAIGHDKTRLIAVLDALESAGLITREADPSDRRARLVRITPAGLARHAAAVADIRAMEDDLLSALAPGERSAFLSALARLGS
jgi:DNA-binding MarR family transcriptional regulator